MITDSLNKNSIAIWQTAKLGIVPEPALLIEPCKDFFYIKQGKDEISIDLGTIPELITALKSLQS